MTKLIRLNQINDPWSEPIIHKFVNHGFPIRKGYCFKEGDMKSYILTYGKGQIKIRSLFLNNEILPEGCFIKQISTN